MIARIAAASGVPPSFIMDNWTAQDITLLERVDGTCGLPDRQIVMLLAAAISSMGGQSPEELFKTLFPEGL